MLVAAGPVASAATIAEGEGDGYVISPVAIEATLEPGGERTERIRIRNLEDAPLEFTVTASGAAPDGRVGGGLFPVSEQDGVVDAGAWVEPMVDRVTIPPRTVSWIEVRIAPPANATPGGHYAAVGIDLVPVEEGSAGLTVGAWVLLLLTIEGEVVSDAVARLEPTRRLSIGGPPQWRLLVENRGNVHQPVQGVVEVAVRPGGVRELEVARQWAFPGQERVFEVGSGGEARPLPRRIRASYASRDGSLEAGPATAWVIPWWSILFLGALVVTTIVTGTKYFRGSCR